MAEWLAESWPTIAVGLVVLGAVAAVVVKLVRDKKRGRSGCGCNCDGCPNAAMCHAQGKKQVPGVRS